VEAEGMGTVQPGGMMPPSTAAGTAAATCTANFEMHGSPHGLLF
jgi:hypothetical protein